MFKKKEEIIKSLAINSKDTGSSEVQIGILSEKIKKLTNHFKIFARDKHSSQGLLKAVNKRKSLLKYLKRTNPESYDQILKKLNLRK